MRFSKRLNLFFIRIWEPLFGGLLAIAFVIFLLTYRLGSLIASLSTAELSQIRTSTSLNSILSNPVNLPYKLLHYLLSLAGQNNAFIERLISSLIGLLVVCLFYYVVSKWNSKLITVLATVLLVCSSWFLHYARFATPDILQTVLIAVLAYGLWMRNTHRSATAIGLGIISGTLLLYIPGFAWLILIGVLWQRKAIASHIKSAALPTVPFLILGGLLLTPLTVSILRSPFVLKSILGIPTSFPSATLIARHILSVPKQLFFRGPADPTVWLGRLPLLDIFSSVMFILGLYELLMRRQLDRTKLLLVWLVFGTLLTGLGGSVSSLILLVPIYLIISLGLAYMHRQWFSVFPSNPLARFIGLGLIVITVLLSCLYNLKAYFVAWPGSTPTKQAFSQRR